jgi:trimeric autotransporter adhesin
MKKNLLLPSLAYLFLNFQTNAQSLGINTDGSIPFSGAMLDVKSSNKGMLIPRIALTGTNDNTSVPLRTESLLIYNTTSSSGPNAVSPGYYYWNVSAWVRLITSDYFAGSAWLTHGNAGTTQVSNFMGTTDNNSVIFKVNNQKAGHIGVQTNDGNVFWGYQSGNNNTGYSNVGIGIKALFNNTNISNLVAIGDSALFSNGLNIVYSGEGVNNTAIGSKSLYANTQGTGNTANGYQSLYSNTTGNFNTANGNFTLRNNIYGHGNTAIGSIALYVNTLGSVNTAIGYSTLIANTTGNSNIANGFQALVSNTEGNSNTAIGSNALTTNTVGDYNTALGAFANVSSSALENATAIGYNSLVNASNKVRIGNSAVTVIEGQVPFTTPSDGRFKFNIREDVTGLNFIMKLRPITYQFDVKRYDENLQSPLLSKEINNPMKASYNEASAIRRTGFIAQEVEKAAIESGFDFGGIIKPKSEKEYYGLSYESFVVPLVKAIQEQQKIIESLNQKIIQLKDHDNVIDAQNKKIGLENEQLRKENESLNNLKNEFEELKKRIEKLSNK